MDYEKEEELVFRRFPEEKQDQVRQLVGYAMLMGLDGKDLVSIGGKLDRLKQARQKKANMEIVKSFELLPIGKGTSHRSSHDRFKLKTTTGTYNFECHYSEWKVTSLATKVVKRHDPDIYGKDLPKCAYDKRKQYAMLLDIASGDFKLNF